MPRNAILSRTKLKLAHMIGTRHPIDLNNYIAFSCGYTRTYKTPRLIETNMLMHTNLRQIN